MKIWKFFVCLCTLIFCFSMAISVAADDEMLKIKQMIEDKIIEYYDTILLSAENESDIVTVGEGVMNHHLKYNLLEQTKGKNVDMDALLSDLDSYSYPLYISGKPIGVVVAEKYNGEYHVVCVEKGEAPNRFIQIMESTDTAHLKFVNDIPIAYGFIIQDKDKKQFVELIPDQSIERISAILDNDTATELFYERYKSIDTSLLETADILWIIQRRLEEKSIQDYEMILMPLRGDPENFNIKPTDDLETITFGKGAALYSVDYELLKKNYKAGKKTVSEALVELNIYAFPVIVSDRVVATVEIIRKGNAYNVFCVSSGSMSEKFARAVDNLQMDEAKYVDEPPIKGFVIKKTDGEEFLDLSADTETPNKVKSAESGNLAELFLERYEEVQANKGLTCGSGTDDTEIHTYGTIVVWSIFILAVLSGIIIFIYRRKRI